MIGTHYNILGISNNATPDEIKKAYRKLSIKFHPDKNEGDEYFSQMFRQINAAYLVLSDVEKRRKYDFQLREQANAKSSAERLKKLEKELAYKDSVLRQKSVFSAAERYEQWNTPQKQSFKAPVKINHVKYFLWLVIVGLVIMIGTKSESSGNNSISKEKTYTKSNKKNTKKKRKKSNTQVIKADTIQKMEEPIAKVDTIEAKFNELSTSVEGDTTDIR